MEGSWLCPACNTENAESENACTSCRCPRLEEHINVAAVDLLLKIFLKMVEEHAIKDTTDTNIEDVLKKITDSQKKKGQ